MNSWPLHQERFFPPSQEFRLSNGFETYGFGLQAEIGLSVSHAKGRDDVLFLLSSLRILESCIERLYRLERLHRMALNVRCLIQQVYFV